MKKSLLAAMLALTALPASADIFGLSVGATAGAAQLDFKGNTEYGFEYGVNASYQLNDFFSINAGVVQGSAEVDAELSASKNDIDYTAFPVTFRGDIPLLIGSLYAKAGTNYYDVDIEQSGVKATDDGWAFTGGAGFVFTLLPLVDLSLGYEYRDMGEVKNNAVVVGVDISL
ncbi:porin family protein [Photobacterium chitinilyticum]|uniref:Porin family protein n=1 Tax=Photobacterium chitinilyticum TaxID=2485123 RepID=A0A3S3S2B0_9GAMM|nr:porin family protein [Photobacterium chitinilyticum]RWX56376.1 porin family protein [Photobacterium chitinilyticum]